MSLFIFFSSRQRSVCAFSPVSLSSPPGSPTTIGFFPSPSSLSSPGGLVRMPGLTYNSNGVKDLINAVQGYPVRTMRNNFLLLQLIYV